MNMNPLGRISVPTPGTPAALPNVTAAKILFQVIPGATGKTYVGRPGMNKTTLAGVACILPPNTGANTSNSFFLESSDATDAIRLGEYTIDADVSGEGLLVTYWQS